MNNLIFDFAGVISKYNQDDFINSFNFNPKAKAVIKNSFASPAFAYYQMGEIARDDFYTLMTLKHPEYAEEFNSLKNADYNFHFKPNQELLNFIKSLKSQGKKVFIMSNTTPETADVITHSDYAKLFDGLIFSTDTHTLKPEEKAYKMALKYFKLNANDTIFIDDSKKNVMGAKKVGLTGIHFTSTPQAIVDINKQLEQKTLI